MSTLSVWTSPFDSFFGRPVGATPARSRSGFVPAADVTRDGEDAILRLELPGVDTADVTVEVVGDRLVVRGERHDRHSSRDGRTSEVRYGSFRRSFGLPAHVSADAVSASYDAGVLTVRVAGVHVEPAAHRVEIGGTGTTGTGETGTGETETGTTEHDEPGESGPQAA